MRVADELGCTSEAFADHADRRGAIIGLANQVGRLEGGGQQRAIQLEQRYRAILAKRDRSEQVGEVAGIDADNSRAEQSIRFGFDFA